MVENAGPPFESEHTPIPVGGDFATDSGTSHFAAVVAGQGIDRLTDLHSQLDIEDLGLVELLPEYADDTQYPKYAVFPAGHRSASDIRAFIDFLPAKGLYRLFDADPRVA